MRKYFTEINTEFSSLVDLLRGRALQQPDQLAYTFLSDDGRAEVSLTYGELDRQARAIGTLLQDKGATGERVLLLYPPGLEYIAAFFGCLYAGVVTIPVYPPQWNRSMSRLQAIMANAQATLAMTTAQILGTAMQHLAQFPELSALQWLTAHDIAPGMDHGWQEQAIAGNTLAFLQYTSGSTATPRGVMLTHENLLHNLALLHDCFELTPDSRGVVWLPPYHDMGLIGGILQPLYGGFPVTLMSPAEFLQRPLRWLQAISQYRGTASGGPNFAYDLCVRKITPEQRATLDLSCWTVAFNGAEPIRAQTLESFTKAFAPCGFRREAFYPCYGLAEATLIVSGGSRSAPPVVQAFEEAALEHNRVVADAAEGKDAYKLVGCGHELPGQQIVIVDPVTLKRCRPNQIGEIWVAGQSIAQGYWNQPAETTSTFHATLADTAHVPFLRTGDLGGIYDGELFVTGRLKDMIIIRGRNHYPQDIELTVERTHPALRPGCGAAFSVEIDGSEQLVVVQEIERQYRNVNMEEVASAIRQAVAENHELQAYAILLIKTGSIPKTSSGKIQRHACKVQFLAGTLSLVGKSILDDLYTGDGEETLSREALLAASPDDRQQMLVFHLQGRAAQVLKVARHLVEPQQPLSTLGLDSLMALDLKSYIETHLDVQLPMINFLRGDSIVHLSTEVLTQLMVPSATAIPGQQAMDDIVPLTAGQRALWFLHQLAPESTAYNIAHAVRLQGNCNISALHRAFHALVDRHAALSTTFAIQNGVPVQIEHRPGEFAFQEEDATNWSEEQLDEEVAEYARLPFDLNRGPLLRVHLFKRSASEYILLLVIHHIVADLWSLTVLVQELDKLYAAEIAGYSISLPPPALQYSDYVRWQAQMLEGDEGERLWKFWQRQLSGDLPALNIPTDRPRPPVQTYQGETQTFTLDAELTRRLRQFARAEGATLYTTLLAAFQALLYRYTGQEDILVGSPSAGREQLGLVELVGYFVNPIVLRGEVVGNLPFQTFLERMRRIVLEAIAHQDYPFPLLVERLQPVRDASRTPIFQAMFALQKAHHFERLSDFVLGETAARMKLGSLEVIPFPLKGRTAKFDLTLEVVESERELRGRFEYNTDLFTAATITGMIGHWQTLLKGIVDSPEQHVADLPLLTPAEQQQMLRQWNAETAVYPQDMCLHELFEVQVACTPEIKALIYKDQELTYAELNRRTNQLAHHLRQLGVGPEVRVGIYMERSVELIVGLLGVLKAGGAYVPLDPDYPVERLAFMLEDGKVSVLLTQREIINRRPTVKQLRPSIIPEEPLADQPTNDGFHIVYLDTDWSHVGQESGENPQITVKPSNAAYIIYTSGSTGKPKGVCCAHSGVINLLTDFARRQPLAAGDGCGLWTSLSFDVSVYEIFSALLAGGTLFIAPDDVRADSRQFIEWLSINRISSAYIPPYMLADLTEWVQPPAAPLALRRLLVGVEPIYEPLLATINAQIPSLHIINGYGPTEASICATLYSIRPQRIKNRTTPIGRPVVNMQIYLLNDHMQPVPCGVTGEVYIGGVGVARGYLNRPDVTAERFVPDPFGGQPGARLYRTGDLARYLSDGNIEFLGRLDYQIKIRGFRVELGEIEATLARYPGVRENVVLAHEYRSWDGERQKQDLHRRDKRLAAYVVPSAGQALTSADLRHYLQEYLPDYMVPTSFILLEALPLTPNGKLDRRALPAPESMQADEVEAYVAPRTPLEEVLAEIWATVLGIERPGNHSHFFDLGGHSLLATQLISRVRTALATDIPLRALFEAPTVAGLATWIEAARRTGLNTEVLPIERAARDGALPLSFAQQRLWLLEQLEPETGTYTIPAAVRLLGRLDVTALERSLNEIVQRHEILRTTFLAVDGHPQQIIAESMPEVITIVEITGLPLNEREREAFQIMAGEIKRPFDLAHGPLIRVRLLRLEEETCILLLTMHHIIADGWSIGVLVRELTDLYRAFSTGQSSPLPILPIQYVDYAHWQRKWLAGERMVRQLAYWQKQLAGTPEVLELPTDWPRSPVQTFCGATYPFTVPKAVVERLSQLSQQQGITLFMTLLAAFQVMLARYSGQTDIVVGTPIAGRTRPETEELIGFFVNTLALRTNLAGNPTFYELLTRVREVCLEAYAHQDVPFEMIVETLQLKRDLSRSPLVQVVFALQNAPMPALNLLDLDIFPIELESGTAKFDLTVTIDENEQGLMGTVEYNTGLFGEATIGRMTGHYQTLLEGIAAHPEQHLADLPLLTRDERQQMLVDWNATQRPYPRDACIHRLFEAQADRTPEAIALGLEHMQLTYGELNVRANRLAHYLQTLGVGPEVLVGICVERSLELIVSLLAILKAGGVYVPLDPAYPPERLAFMLEDTQAPVLLTQESLSHHFTEIVQSGASRTQAAPAVLLADQLVMDSFSAENPASEVVAENLAYVMYTSGSTGRPKGVGVTHRNVVRLVKETNYAILSAEEVFLQFAPVSFDPSTLEIWGALLNGARLVLFPAFTPSLEELGRALEHYHITVLWLTAGLFHQMVESQLASLQQVRQLLAGGDVLSVPHVQKLLQAGGTVINGYGPTENTTFSCCYSVTKPDQVGTSVPIGRPIAQTQVYVLDSYLQPVPVGVPGELYLGGDGVARGYLQRPEMTAERFVPCPFSLESGARLYRTGDLVRYRGDGVLEFLGRLDTQVKLRGYRVELGEIETLLSQHPAVTDAIVIAREDTPGDKRLVAYVVILPGSPVTPVDLRQYLHDSLPDYMVPAIVDPLDYLPLTPNGKVDRRALPVPGWTAHAPAQVVVAPRTPIEEVLLGIWAEVLGVNPAQMSVDDNFFDSGGHSLLATQVVSRLREVFAVELPLRTLFAAPTVAGLAGQVELARQQKSEATSMSIKRVSRQEPLPLSFAQQRLWFLDQLSPQSNTYTIAAAVRLRGCLHLEALQRGLQYLIERHEVLRTRFVVVDDQPVQVIVPQAEADVHIHDVGELPENGREKQVARLLALEVERPFDLAHGPLVRMMVLRVQQAQTSATAEQGAMGAAGEDESVVLLTLHHIVADGWSIGVLVRELAIVYAALVQGRDIALPELPIQYADYAAWQRKWLIGERLEQQISYWRTQLAAAPEALELPTDRPRPAVQTFNGELHAFNLNPALTADLKRLSQHEGVTLFMTLLAAFQVLLAHYSGQSDVVVGSPIANRMRVETEGVIGFFVNTLALRTDISGTPSFHELLARVREVTLEAYAHQDVPFEKLVEVLQPERDLSRSPLFQILFELQNAPPVKLELSGLQLEPVIVDTGAAKFDLTLLLEEHNQELIGVVEYNTDLFDAETIVRMIGHWQTLLEGIVAHPEDRVTDLPLLTEAELHFLREGNATQALYPGEQCVHQLFEEQVTRTPEAEAVVFADEQLTYRELNRRANQLAYTLQARGVGPERLVGICMERSLELVVALLAVLKAGGAYVPLDPDYPQDRLAYMVRDAHVPVLLTQTRWRNLLPDEDIQVLCLDPGWNTSDEQENPVSQVQPGCMAYMIYTSGSTGRPKGVINIHRGLCNRLHWMQQAYPLTSEDRVLQKTPFSFDVSVWEFFWPLLTGACLVVARPGGHQDPAYLASLIAEQQVTTLHFVPSMLHAFLLEPGLEKSCKSLKRVICSGEALPFELQKRFFSRLDAELHNLYGPTEASIDVTFWQCQQKSHDLMVPIGHPIANTQIYILDQSSHPVPIGVTGELYIGGEGLARGYLNRPDLTADRFVPSPQGPPFSTEPGGRLYKTGDLARYRRDGAIEFLGRIDHQVKIRGFRIELGEIEAVLHQYPGVQKALVVAREDVPGDKRLVAYLVARLEHSSPTVDGLRAYLYSQLPDYMVPAAFVLLEALPMTPNGKVDRKALPAPEWSGRVETFVAPRTPIEQVLASIWAEMLDIVPGRIGIHDNFFELGGHSLLATQVRSRLRSTLAVEIPLRSLFTSPTIATLAEQIEHARRAGKPEEHVPLHLARRTGNEDLPLSFAQQRLWFLDQWEPGNPFYNISLAVRLWGRLYVPALERSLQMVIQRHEGLRTTFVSVGGRPRQVIAPHEELSLPLEDLSSLPQAQREEMAIQFASQEAQRPFDLVQGPLLRVRLLRLQDQEHLLLLSMHHIVADGWSMGILVQEVSRLYAAAVNGQQIELAELPLQYADYALWQREWLQGGVLECQLAYWRQQLAALSTLNLPTDHPRSAVQRFQGATYPFQLPVELQLALQRLSQQEGITLFTTLLTAFQVLLARYTGQKDIAVGTPIANRTLKETEGLIGFFANTLVLRADLGGDPSFHELLRRVWDVCLDAYMHQDVPFEKLVEELQPERDMSRSPLFQVMFSFQNSPVAAPDLPGLELKPLVLNSGTAKFDLMLLFDEGEQGLKGMLEYNTDLFEANTIERMAEHYQTLLEGVLTNPELPVSYLPILTPRERQRILVEWNTVSADFSPQVCLHHLVEAQVTRAPNSLAVVYDAAEDDWEGKPEITTLTYAELNCRANQVAYYLRRLGVGPDDIVGVCAERSLELVIGLLGILKAGAAYMPLDPDYPPSRLAYMLEDAQVHLVLAQERFRSILPAQTMVVALDGSSWAEEQTGNPTVDVTPQHLAYVIYTSGSTGDPKGALIEHQAISNNLLWMQRDWPLGPTDRLLQKTPFTFDVSVKEVFWPLLAGAQVVLAQPGGQRDPEYLRALIKRAKITVTHFVPSMLQAFLAGPVGPEVESLRLVMCGAEALPVSLQDRFFLLLPADLLHLYGPTETAIAVTGWICERGSQRERVPLGGPMPHVQLYVLDAALQPVPIGVPGELYIGGLALGRGYLNRPDETAEKFIPHPFGRQMGERLYKTGDLARYLEDGNLEYLGRLDQQVKIRGLRVELGEIEVAIQRHPEVREAVVLVWERQPGVAFPTPMDKRLIAYVVAHPGKTLTTQELRQYIQERLPDYMVPATFMLLETMPLNANGKVDRRALPFPDEERPDLDTEFIAPRTPVEESIAAIWRETLGLEQVGINDDFFTLGGHSLLAVQVVSRLRDTFDIELPLRALFEAPSITGIASAIERAKGTGVAAQRPAIKPVSRDLYRQKIRHVSKSAS